jgi:hypothetical protein
MSSLHPDLPPFVVIQAALRKTTEHLAHELQRPTATAPQWSEFEWTIARAVAAMQGISALLASKLRWRGPARWQTFLAEQQALARQRDAVIARTLDTLNAVSIEHGLACVGLKGAALRKLGLYAPGERPMGDIDILVREEDRAHFATVMQTLGYRDAYAVRRHEVFEPANESTAVHAGEHPDNPLKIEVHTLIAEFLPAHLVDITRELSPEKMRAGLNPYRDHVALLRHLLLHAAGNMRANALRQIQVHDIARLATVLAPADWGALTRMSSAQSGVWWSFPPLVLAERYYPGSIPAHVLQETARQCPRVLRAAAVRTSITQVSWSNLRIHAFPGLTWARSPLEALRFVRSRIWPQRWAIDELSLATRLSPSLRRLRWYDESHSRRIARWLVSRPPRVQTMLSVCAALNIDP